MEPLITRPEIWYSCEEYKKREGQQFVPEHGMARVLAGTLEVYWDNSIHIFRPGDILICKKYALGKFVKYPNEEGGVFKSVTVGFYPDVLRRFSIEYNIQPDTDYTGPALELLKPNILMDNFFSSLLPYFDVTNNLSADLIDIKVKEAILLLLRVKPGIKNMLFDFRQPGKINLEEYMLSNYMFNLPVGRFAQLTGRSLTAFKRDFEAIFKTSPGKWLQERRLNEARYLIKEKHKKPSDIYLDVGFEDLSHFSFAFKKQFGIAPSFV